MKYFDQDFITFFETLASNNNKEWFHANKKRYETSVKKPFEQFIDDLIHEIKTHEPDLQITAKDCVLRINRDIRFAKDKSPYNLHYTAFVSPGGRKNKSIPGLFIRCSAEMVGIMGGCFGPDKDQLSGIRKSIQKNPETIQALLQASDFKAHFGAIKGEEMKRIPKDLQEAVAKEPLIAKKQFYFVAELEAIAMTKDDFLEKVMQHWHAMKPINDYLKQAIQ